MPLLSFAGSAIQLVPDGTLVFHVATIAVMVALLNFTLLKPINRILEDRERRTKGRITEAQAILSNMSSKLREYERQLRQARAEGYKLLEKERTALSREREQRVGDAKLEATNWINDERKQLRTEAEQAKASLGTEARSTAQDIGKRILGRELTF